MSDQFSESEIDKRTIGELQAKLRMAIDLLKTKSGHYYCDDSFYSCPFSDVVGEETECSCGAIEFQNKISELETNAAQLR